MKKSYTILTVFLLMIIGSSGAFAQILIENFNYTNSATDGLAKQSSGAWFNVNSGDSVLVDVGSLSYTGYPTSIGNKIKFDGTGVDPQRTFTAQTAGTVYYSFLLNCTSLTGVTSTTGSYFTGFRGGSTSTFGGCIWLKNNDGNSFFIGVSPRSSGGTPVQTFSTASYPINTTLLIVVAYQIVSGTSNDVVKLWVNPSVGGVEPAPDFTITNNSTSGDLASVDGIFIRQDAIVGTPFLQVDEQHIGTSWNNSVNGVLEPNAVFNKKTASYGKVNVGNSVFDTVTVTNSGMATLNISAVTSGSGLFVVNPLSATILTGASQKFSMKFTPTATAVTNSAVVFTSNAPSSPDSVTVSGEGVQAGFTLSRSSISFGTIWKDSTATDSVIITNIGKTSHLLVDSVRSTNSLFTVLPSGSADLDTSASKTYVVKFSPTSKGAQSGSIVFFHNAPSLRDTVKVTGSGKIKEALFTATPVSLNFGAILKGKTKKDSITIKNTGNDSLFITSVASSNNQFTLTPSSARLDTSASQKFYVTFAPTSTGIQATALVFTTNTAEVTDTVKAKGTSVPAVTIAEARKDTNSDFIADHSVSKDTLVIYGVITSPNFQSTQTSYFIQDSSAGINIFSFTLTSTNFAIGDSVFVIGYVAQFRGLTEFTPLTVDSVNFGIIKHNAIVPKPKRLTLHQFVLSPESYEGQLIEVDTLYKATGTWPAAGAYASVYVTNVTKADTAQMFLDNDTNIDGSVEPEYPLNVVGIVSQYSSASTVYNNGYEIMPRDTADINPPQPVVRMASTLTTSKIQTTVTNVGHIGGLNDFQDKVGVKFGGMERMFEGSFIFTTDSAHVSNAWRNRLGAYSSGFRPLKNIKISPVGTSIRTETMYDDSNQVRPLGIAVIEKTLVDTSAGKAGYLLVQLGVINKTNAKISKLRVGAFLDFDMTAAGTTDRGGIIRDSTNVITGVNGGNPFKMHVAYEQESGVNTAFLGIVPLSQGQLSGGRISSGAAEIYPTGVAFTDSIKNNFVSTFRATNMFTDNGKSDDQSIIASVGPYDINAKDTVRAAFAVISGSSLGDLIATARLAQRDYVAIGNAFGPVTKVNPEEIPLTFALDQNFPNPFNPTTMIRFALPKESKVSLKVYDVIGREVRTLVNGDLAAGINTVEWNGRNNLGQSVASGMYLYRIQAGTFVSTKKMMLLK